MKTFTYFAKVCPTCGKPPGAPFRVYDKSGKVISGCVDEFHTGHLVTPSESARWHYRQAAKKIRAEMKRGRLGGVTRYGNPRHPPDRRDVIASRKRTAQRVKEMQKGLKKRKRNPRQDWYIHIQRHNGPVMLYNGNSFSDPRNAKPFPFQSANSAMYKARWLLGKFHRQLSRYKIWVSDQYHGAPTVDTRVNPRRRNPEKLDEAARKLEDFTGREATHVERAPARSDEKTGLVMGELQAVEYLAAREGIEGGKMVRWHHKFRKNSRPLLAVSTDGKQLHVVGGQYEFTDAGIEDR